LGPPPGGDLDQARDDAFRDGWDCYTMA
jgi:hypothetical protein